MRKPSINIPTICIAAAGNAHLQLYLCSGVLTCLIRRARSVAASIPLAMGLWLTFQMGFHPVTVRAQPSPVSPDPFINKKLLTQQEICAATFPLPHSSVFIPLFAHHRALPEDEPEDAGESLSKVIDAIVPLGDQLGDVGQYYSQVAPSISSQILITNTTSRTQSLSVTLYEDMGIVAREMTGCNLEQKQSYALSIRDGELVFTQNGEQTPADIFCSDLSRAQEQRQDADLRLHGIYHARLATEDPDAIDVSMYNELDSAHTAIQYETVSRYPALPSSAATSTAGMAAVLVTRSVDNWWDTEIVVQNISDRGIELTFEICDERGRCFDNNRATLAANERRSFLASHLLYADSDGFLEERSGWFSMRAISKATEDGSSPPQIAVVSHMFRQPVPTGQVAPQAEQGSSCLLSAAHGGDTTQHYFFLSPSRELFVRLFNPTAAQNEVTIEIFNQRGIRAILLRRTIGSQATETIQLADELDAMDESILPNIRSMQIRASDVIAAFVWQDGKIRHRLSPPAAVTEWDVPFIGAPVVEFQWDTDTQNDIQRPASRFGLADTVPPNHNMRPEWARRMNWYSWRAVREYCSEPVSDDVPHSTYIAMWWGLGRCGADPADRSCVNSVERMNRIRNMIPSNCPGRPLFLANEPDLPAQAYMSYHELGRMLYVFRQWPGQLFSPVFASWQYDAPSYVGEPRGWCWGAVESGRCPADPECSQCIQDGVVDGMWDPHDIHFQGLEAYFALSDLWARGQSWPIESVLEGMNVHVYLDLPTLQGDTHWRAPHLRRFRDRAKEAGWPIIVKEYGFATWRDFFGNPSGIDYCDVSNHVDNLRRIVQQNLGNYAEEFDHNPQKLFWFHTGCQPGVLEDYEVLCLFSDPVTLSTPVGQCWYDDVVNPSSENRTCDSSCGGTLLPPNSP